MSRASCLRPGIARKRSKRGDRERGDRHHHAGRAGRRCEAHHRSADSGQAPSAKKILGPPRFRSGRQAIGRAAASVRLVRAHFDASRCPQPLLAPRFECGGVYLFGLPVRFPRKRSDSHMCGSSPARSTHSVCPSRPIPRRTRHCLLLPFGTPRRRRSRHSIKPKPPRPGHVPPRGAFARSGARTLSRPHEPMSTAQTDPMSIRAQEYSRRVRLAT